MDPQQRTCSVEKSLSASFAKKEKLIKQTVSQGNIHGPESRGAYSIGEDLWRQLKRIQYQCLMGTKGVTEIGKLHLCRA